MKRNKIYVSRRPYVKSEKRSTGNPFDSKSPLFALRDGRGARIPIFTLSTIAFLLKKSSDQTAIDFSQNDEQTLSPAEHWPPFITLEVQSDSQPKPCSHS